MRKLHFLIAAAFMLSMPDALAISRWNVFVGYTSWQEPFSVTTETGQTLPAVSTAVGACPGVAWRQQLTPLWETLVTGCGFAGSADFSDTDQARYTSKGSTVFGFKSTVGLSWRAPSNRSSSVGFGIPIIYRYGLWPELPPNVRLDTRAPVLIGAAIQTSIERGSFAISPEAGFLKSFSYFYWSLQLGWKL